MSIFSSHHNRLSNIWDVNFKSRGYQVPSSKNKQFDDISLDKKIIIKRLQKLMLDSKDLDTKMFISKTISFLAQNLSDQNSPFKHIDISNDEKENLQKNVKSNQLLNNFSQIRTSQTTNNIEVSMMIPVVCDSNIQLGNQSKCFGQTATSEGFLSSNIGFKALGPSVIQQIVSEAGTVQCQCGLLEWLLQMVSRLMERGIVKNRQQEENQFLQVDETFIKDITQQIADSWILFEEKSKQLSDKYQQNKDSEQWLKNQNELLKNQHHKMTDICSLTKQQNRLLNQKLVQLSAQIAKASLHLLNLKSSSSQTQRQLAQMKYKKDCLDDKLAINLKNLQKSLSAKSFLEETKNLEIDSLKLQIELKDNQICKMKTIIESLEKKSSQYDSEIESLKKILPSSQSSISIDVNYLIHISSTLWPVQKSHERLEELNITSGNSTQLKQLKKLKFQNQVLKQQCTLLHQKIIKTELFGLI